jgi:hypothetical protein
MKIVSLKRLGNIENELIEKYPDISFLFYDKADNIKLTIFIYLTPAFVLIHLFVF